MCTKVKAGKQIKQSVLEVDIKGLEYGVGSLSILVILASDMRDLCVKADFKKKKKSSGRPVFKPARIAFEINILLNPGTNVPERSRSKVCSMNRMLRAYRTCPTAVHPFSLPHRFFSSLSPAQACHSNQTKVLSPSRQHAACHSNLEDQASASPQHPNPNRRQ